MKHGSGNLEPSEQPSGRDVLPSRSERARRRTALVLVTCLLGLVLAGCDLGRRRVLVWHDWPAPEAEVLIDLLNGYAELDPDLRLIIEYIPADEIESRFADEVQSGFGPDVLIGVDADRLSDLVSAEAVHRITPAQSESHRFDQPESRAMEAMVINGEQQGIPFAGFTDVLYFRDGIDPPETLDAIIELAEAGFSTGIPVDFVGTYWGVDAFGGTAFGNDDALDPDQGFVEWMKWLVEARPQPNIILDGDYESLRDSFAAGRIDLFIGGSRELGTFRSDLSATVATGGGADQVEAAGDSAESAALSDIDDITFGLTTLPGGVNDSPGGFLEIEGMVVNRHTATLDESLALLEYLTNVPSQGRIARSGLGRIPINESVSIDPTISPIEAALLVQQRRSVVLPRRFQGNLSELRELDNEIYRQVARGLVKPAAAAVVLRETYDEILEQGR